MNKTTETFTRYDAADYLTSIDDTAAYLEAAIEQSGNDPTLITQALSTIARSGNVADLARRAGMSREGLYQALSANGNPSFATILKITHALGLRLHVMSVA